MTPPDSVMVLLHQLRESQTNEFIWMGAVLCLVMVLTVANFLKPRR